MPRKAKTTKTVTKPETKVETKVEPKTTPVVEKKGKAPKRKPKTVEKPVVETVPETVEEETTVAETTEEPETKRKRLVPTRDLVLENFDETLKFIDEEVNKRREDSSKSKGVKFLRSLNKRIKVLKNQAARVMKQRQKTERKNNNSGFLKPVKISKELAKFTGWDPEQLKSRVDVTKYICDYIKNNDLQNPADRRQIQIEKDTRLSKLLDYNNTDEDKPLTYYRLQTYMKKHFVKDA